MTSSLSVCRFLVNTPEASALLEVSLYELELTRETRPLVEAHVVNVEEMRACDTLCSRAQVSEHKVGRKARLLRIAGMTDEFARRPEEGRA